MKVRVFAIALILFCLPLGNVSSQPNPELGTWELGLDYIDDDPNRPFLVDKDGNVMITFWVDNSQMMEIEVEFEYTIPFDGESDAEESAMIPASTNKSFTLSISAIDVYNIAAESRDTFTITTNLVSRAGVPAIVPENREESADLKIPTIYALDVLIAEPAGPMSAGTDMPLKVTLENLGNVKDRAGEIDISDNCPLLTSDNGLDKLLTTEINPGAKANANLMLSASESHPQRNCKVEVSIHSNGAMNSGSTVIVEDEVSITVDPPIKRPIDDPEEPDDPEDPIEVVSSNLPAPGILAVLLTIALASIVVRKDV